jgi:glycoside/pentoside/hexuronide:cation symporter, GPH family
MSAGLPAWVKLAYGAGAGGWVIIDRVLLTWLYYFYVTAPDGDTVAYLAPLAFSVIMLAGRLVDSLADPVIARLSDNHGGRRGRRIPFMAVSGVFYVAVFIALFFPPVPGPSAWNGAYLVVGLGVYFVLFTAYVGPYLALLADLSPVTKDRVDLSTAKAVATLVGAAVALIGSGLLIDAFGMRGMVWALASLGLVLLYVPVTIPERRWATAEPATLPLVEAVRTTLRNRPFLVALLGINAFWFGFNIVTLNIPLYVTSLLGMSEGAVALFMGAAFGVAMLMFPFVNVAAKRRGLKAVMVASLFAFAACFPLLYFFGAAPLGIPPLAFGLAVMGFAGIPLAGFFIVPDAIIATVADLEERLSGQRREGMYFGVNGLFLKVNLGVSTVVSGALLQSFGDPLGIQLTGPVAAVAVLAGAVVFTRYPEARMTESRKALLAPPEV